MPESQEHFAQPWQVVEHMELFEVRTLSGTSLAFIPFGQEHPTSDDSKARLTNDEARRLAHVIARLPDLFKDEKQR